MMYFVLRNPNVEEYWSVTDYVTIEESVLGEAPTCPVCGNFIGMLPILPPIVVEIKSQGYQWSHISFGSGNELLFSDQLKREILSRNLIGIERIEPVSISKSKGRSRFMPQPPEYWMCSITFSRKAVDDEKSENVRQRSRTCPHCRIGGLIESVGKVALEKDDMSTEDIFNPRGLPGTVIVSENFKNVCSELKLPDCYFDPID